MNSEIRHVVLTDLNSFLRQSCLVSTCVNSALDVSQCNVLYKPKCYFTLFYLLVEMRLSNQFGNKVKTDVHWWYTSDGQRQQFTWIALQRYPVRKYSVFTGNRKYETNMHSIENTAQQVKARYDYMITYDYMDPMSKGSIVVAVLQRSWSFEPQYKLSILLYIYNTKTR